MNHRVKAKHFNRDTKSRKALLKNLLRSLFEQGHITTSESRAKEVRRLADKMISTALKNTLAARRELHKVFGRRDVVNALVDKIAPSLSAKKSGFTALEKLAARRGDNTMMFKLSLLTGDFKWTSLKKEQAEVTKTASQDKKTAPKKIVKTVVKKTIAKAAIKTSQKTTSKSAKKKSEEKK